MLLPDGGETLRAAGGAASVEAWEAMLRDYARLQLELVPRADAVVSHPFVSLLVALRVAQRALDVPNGDPALLRLRDAYLDVWRAYGSLPELRAQADLALTVGPLLRALSWRRILHGVHPAERTEWQDAVPGWTAGALEPGTLSEV